MDFATGALGPLLLKLGHLLQDEYNLQVGVKKDIEFVTRELESMHAALRDVGEVPQEQLSNIVKIWAQDVRELSYEMEDIVDTFLVCVQGSKRPSRRSAKRFIKKMTSSITEFTTRREIGQEIKNIKERVKEMAERRDRYHVNTFSPQTTMLDPRLTYLYTKESELVGIQQAREQLITMLTKGDDMSTQQQRVVSIVGIGGLGKTTVAKAVYEYLKAEFNCSAFVTVSRNPDTKKILKDLLYELDKEKYRSIHNDKFDEKHLIDITQEFLQNKRYIIVIDDIWEPHSWETIKLALVENNCGSTIIATTRNSEAVIGEIYKLPPLSLYNSKKLFYTRIFGSEGKSLDDQQEEVSNKFLKKCDGIPLAIITMASLLAGKPIEIWPELYTAVSFSHKDNMQVQNTMKIISFSYYDMPSHLRTCLLYLSAFPEDHVINKDALIWKWIAEGFILPREEGNELFEIGERYFNDLINRSLIQVKYMYDDCEVQGCRVHDMVLDLIRSLSREENFVTILDNGAETSAQYKNKVCRLAYQKISAEHISSKCDEMDLKHVRSYVANNCGIIQHPLWRFKFLRVLAMEHCGFKEDCHLKNLKKLIHLRYLSLRRTNIRNVPEHIGDLKFLQALDLDETMIKDLPTSIVQLRQLVRLTCRRWCIKEMPDGIGKMTSLKQLRIDVDWRADNIMKELGSLRELRTLDICFLVADYVNVDELGEIREFRIKSPGAMDKSTQRYLVDSLSKLKKIQHLEVGPIEGADIDTWEAEGFVLPQQLRHLSLLWTKFPRLPSCVDLSRLHHLSYLDICVATLVEQDLRLLGRLTELRYLSLRGVIRKGVTVSKINAGDAFFPKLRFFNLPGAMVLFEHKNEDSSFSLHIWNGKDPMPFGSRRNGGACRVRSAIMTNLEHLSTEVYMRALKDGNNDCSIIGMDYLNSLQKVLVHIQCEHASVAEVNQAETALRNAVGGHPNHPTLQLFRRNGNAIISSVQDLVSEHGGIPQTGQDNGGHDDEEVDAPTENADVTKLSLASSYIESKP